MHCIRIPVVVRCLLTAALTLAASSVAARHGEPPYSLAHPAKAGVDVPVEDARAIDATQRRLDADRSVRERGARTKRLQTAEATTVSITPDRNGRWDTLDDGSRLWRMRVRASGATDLRLAFTHYALPRGATLYVIGADDYYQGPYTAADATDATFHAPAVPGDTATIELRVPAGTANDATRLELGNVGAGFRDLFNRKQTLETGPGTSGACNVNVVCPLGQPYTNEIRAVGQYEYQAADDGQYYICTGTLVTDAPRSRKNYFLTAAHCISVASEAQSIVVYWNYQSTQCNVLAAPAGGFLADDQHGGTLRATRADVDFTLIELGGTPDPSWNLYYAGWDASGAAPSATIGIHHPSGDVKKITAGPATTTTDSCIVDVATTPATHWQTGPYSQGTTEGGSSGSGLFVAVGGGLDRRVIGTLSGGLAACSDFSPGEPNNENDCYGKLSVAWNGSSASSRLHDWLDPAGTGATSASGIGQNDPTPASTLGHSTHAIPDLLLHLPHTGAER
jgi:V8-like Glu-specific endopeptidase